MSVPNLVQYGAFLLVVLVLVKPVGGYLQRVFAGQRTFLDPLLRPFERGIYRLAGIYPARPVGGKETAIAFMLLRLLGTMLPDAVPPLPPAGPPPRHPHRTPTPAPAPP